jgi:hypothetical protein
MDHLKVGAAQEADKLTDVGGRPFCSSERVHSDADFLKRIREWAAAMHYGDFDIERGAIAVAEHVDKGGLCSAQVEMVDHMQDSNHPESPLRNA